ncbi:M-phase inducer phosphatase [Spathaspora sp. JA1]|nr:M-phase inducer phosphatase [Spathaspora sp. JA1]
MAYTNISSPIIKRNRGGRFPSAAGGSESPDDKAYEEDYEDYDDEEEDDEEEEDEEIGVSSPLFRRQPFKNLSNLVIPVKKSFSTSTKSFTRSINELSKQFLHNNTKHHIEHKDVLEHEQQEESTEEDQDDTFETITSPTPVQPTVRRFHSMCQTSKEFESFQFQSDNSHLKYTNIVTTTSDTDSLPRIDAEQLYHILHGEHKSAFDECIIIDCRFDYEFEGGHIIGATNLSTKQELENRFIFNPDASQSDIKRLVVFHCEFSVFRGPIMARHLRKCDRMANSHLYPYLTYPDIVVLEQGYKTFFMKYPYLCDPQDYVEMKDLNHESNCADQLHKVRQDSKLVRAKSFANSTTSLFGDSTTISSPTNYHTRSQSYTTITGKVIKRQRSNSKVMSISNSRLTRASTFSYDQSIFSSSSILSSPTTTTTPQNSSLFDEFLPPSTSFRNTNSKSITANSSALSLSDNAFSSSNESLTDGYSSSSSPSCEFEKPLPRPKLRISNPTISSFKFPMKRNWSSQPIMEPSPSLISSPLSLQLTPETDNNELIDPINDTPVECSVLRRYRHGRLSSGNNVGLYSFADLDIDEVEEE